MEENGSITAKYVSYFKSRILLLNFFDCLMGKRHVAVYIASGINEGLFLEAPGGLT